MARVQENSPEANNLDGTAQDDIFEFDAKFGHETITDGRGNDILWFKNVDDDEGFSVTRTDEGVRIEHDSLATSSVTIASDSYAQGRFKIHYGESETPDRDSGTPLGNLRVGQRGEATLEGDERADLMYGTQSEDTLRGYAGNDTLVGGAGDDTYVFGKGDGIDRVVDADDRSKIVFLQGTNNDYEGATYNFARAEGGLSKAVTLTVISSDSNGNTLLNTIEFTTYPSAGYSFYTRDTQGRDTDITDTLSVVQERWGDGREQYPFLATAVADTFPGSADNDWVSYENAGNEGVTLNLETGETREVYAEGDILHGINNVIGSRHDDIITGNGNNNILRGSTGIDRLYGGAGNDILDGGYHADTLDGGAGEDTVSYKESVLGVRVRLAHSAEQRDFDITREGSKANQNEAVGDILVSIENIDGSNYDDWLAGDNNDNKLRGGQGDDFLRGAAGADTLDGGEGTDTASYAIARKGVRIDLTLWEGVQLDFDGSFNFVINNHEAVGDTLVSIENIEGSHHQDWLVGDDKNNAIFGNRGDDFLEGGIGADILYGGEGKDNLKGGDGEDTVSYRYSERAVFVQLSLQGQLQQDFDISNENEAVDDVLISIENLEGSEYDDRLFGDGEGNTLTGRGGDDRLHGGAGNDILDGGEGEDTTSYELAGKGVRVNLAREGAQQDFEEEHGFTANDNEAKGDILANIENLEGTLHNDWLTGDSESNTLRGRAGNDRIEGGAGDDFLYGGDDDDTLIGGTGNDELYGRADDDILAGGLGADYIDGGDGEDTADYSGSRNGVRVELSRTDEQREFDTEFFIHRLRETRGGDAVGDILSNIENIQGSEQSDFIGGSSSANKLWGGGGDDWLFSRRGNDELYGGSGDDILVGGPGADFLDGGEDVDTASYQHSSIAVRVNLLLQGAAQSDFETDTFGYGANNNRAVGDILTNIENLEGSEHSDWLTGDSGSNTLTGRDGNDRLEGGAGSDTLYGGAGEDTLIGGADADVLDGGLATDRASYANADTGVRVDLSHSGAQQDFEEEHGFSANGNEAVGDILANIENIYASNHDDWLTGDELDNIIWGLRGDDRIEGGAGDDALYGGKDDDRLYGGTGNDELYGRDDNDILAGGAGADDIDGGDGEDTADYSGSRNGVRVELSRTNEQQEFDTEFFIHFLRETRGGDAVGDILSNIENIQGSEQDDFIGGSSSANKLWGGGGDDWLLAQLGNDELYGDGGDDILVGGLGADFLDGGEDVDTASYQYSSIGVRVNLLLQGAAQSDFETNDFGYRANNNEAVGDILTNIENLDGSNHSDWLTGDGESNTLKGRVGNDRLEGGAGDDILRGGRDDDHLEGGAGDDILQGGGDDDFLEGGTDADLISGGSGIDIASYSNSAEGVRVDLRLQKQRQQDFEANDFGFAENQGGDGVGDILLNIENVEGSKRDDWLTGDHAVNNLWGLSGDDRLEGGAGNDLLYGQRGADTLAGGADDDSLYGGGGDDTYEFTVGDGIDIIDDATGVMTLRFYNSLYSDAYAAEDFASATMRRVSNNLEIAVDKYSYDGIIDKVTILNAYDDAPDTGTGNLAFTINIEYGSEGSFTEVTDSFWHSL